MFLDLALDLLPVAFNAIPIHGGGLLGCTAVETPAARFRWEIVA
jgi:hypothetical protein